MVRNGNENYILLYNMRKFMLSICATLSCVFLASGQEADAGQFLRGVTNYSQERFAVAEKIFSDLHLSCPEDDAVSYYLGLTEFALGQMDSSEFHLREAVARDTSNVWYLEALGSLYSARGDRSRFAAICEKLLELSPAQYNNPYTLTVVGDEMMNRRQDDKALEYYNRALDIDQDYAPAQLGKLEILRFSGNFPPFFLTLDRFVRNGFVRDDIKSQYVGALIERMDSRFYWVWGEQLGKLVDMCYRQAPEDPGSNLNKLRMCIIENKQDSVIYMCARLADVSRRSGDKENLLLALSTAGDMSYQMGRARDAYRFYEEALEVDPDCTAVLNNYAYYLSEEGKSLRKALKMSRKAIAIEPDNPTFLDTCGWILYLLGRPKEAKPLFKHAMIYGGKDSAVILEHYSVILESLGERDLSIYYNSLAEQKKQKQ